MQNSTLEDKFLEGLKKSGLIPGNSIMGVYFNMFKILKYSDPNFLYEVIKDYLSDKSPENWFSSFHKCMRQCDFFLDFFLVGPYRERTTEENVELRALINIKIENRTETDKLRLKELRRIKRTVKKENIGSNLDLALWELIHTDTDGKLQKFMEDFFILNMNDIENYK